MVKRHSKGVPVCNDCQKEIKGQEKILINRKTGEDFRLCSTCYFFRFKNQENQETIKKNLQPKRPEPTIEEYWAKTSLDRYYLIRHIFKVDTLREIMARDKAQYRVETCKRRIRKLTRR